MQGDVLDGDRPPTVARRVRHGLPLRRERGRASRVRPADPRSRAEHHRHLRRARGDARRGRHTHRLLLHRLGLRRAGGVPHARDVPVPGADLALRRLEARGGRAHPGLRARVRLRRGSSFASSRSSASATRTDTSSTSVGACAQDPSRLRVLGDGRQEKSYLYVGDCISAMTLAIDRQLEPGTVEGLQPRNRRDDRRRRLDRDDHGAARRHARARVHRAASAAGSGTAR